MTDQQIDARIARALRMLVDDYGGGGSSIIVAFRNVAHRLEPPTPPPEIKAVERHGVWYVMRGAQGYSEQRDAFVDGPGSFYPCEFVANAIARALREREAAK